MLVISISHNKGHCVIGPFPIPLSALNPFSVRNSRTIYIINVSHVRTQLEHLWLNTP